MVRERYDYGKEPPRKFSGIAVDWLDHGYYKIRLHGAGPWVPVQVFLEDGDRDPETWDLLSDQWLRAEWYPSTRSDLPYTINPKQLFNRARPISKEEFEWLKILRTIPRQ
jgi:hypothetical protein